MREKESGAASRERRQRLSRGSLGQDRAYIVADYERGTHWAGIAMAASFLLMGLGSVVFGW